MVLSVGLYGPESYAPGRLALLAIGGFMFLWLVYALWLLRRGRVRFAATLLLTALWGVTTLWAWLVGGITDNRIAYVYPLVVVSSGLLLGGRAAAVFAVLSALGIVGAYSAERADRILPLYEGFGPSDLILMISTLIILTIVLLYGRRGLTQALEAAQRSALAQERASRQLEAVQAGLAERFLQRTRELENRAELLQSAVEIGRVAVTMHAPGELMAHVAQRIANSFEFYHVGIYLVDVASNRAVLQAAGGESSTATPLVGYEVSTAEGSVVGECIRSRGPRIAFGARVPRTALAVGEMLLSAHIARLPRTAVEIVLPLIVGGQSIGALDMHMDDVGIFKLEDLEAWQIVSDQVAVAIENARRFAQSQAALEAERDYYGRVSREGWMKLLLSQQVVGYRYKDHHVDPAGDLWPVEMDEVLATDSRVVRAESASEEGGAVVAVPVRARDNTLGVLHLRKRPEAGAWTNRELELLDTLTDQLATALEAARLYRDTQQSAAQQRAIAEVGGGIREEVEIESVLSRALTELSNALAADRGAVLLTLDDTPEDVVTRRVSHD